MSNVGAYAVIVADNSAQVTAEIERVLGNVTEGYANLIAQQAQAAAPVRTGALQASIEAQPTQDPLTWAVAAQVLYSLYVELGTSRAGAKPYLLPALMASYD